MRKDYGPLTTRAASSPELDKITDKVRKLLALSDRAGTEAEALAAAEQARRLVERHNLDMGVLTLPSEPETGESPTALFRRTPPHYVFIASACDVLFDTRFYKSTLITGDTRFIFIGLKANAEAAAVTFAYLTAAVESLLAGRKSAHPWWGRADYRAFRLGASKRIHNMATDTKAAAQGASEETAALVRVSSQVADQEMEKLGPMGNLRVNTETDAKMAELDGYMEGKRIDLNGARKSRMLEAN